MTTSDPIADMLTRIRNALMAKHASVEIPSSKIKVAIAKILTANEKVFVYLQQSEINKVKASSKAAKSEYSPWSTWPDEMAKKTAVKRLCKLLPLSAEQQQRIAADETIKNTIDTDMTEVKDETNWEDGEITNDEKPMTHEEADRQIIESEKQ